MSKHQKTTNMQTNPEQFKNVTKYKRRQGKNSVGSKNRNMKN